MFYFSQRSRVDLQLSSCCHCARVKEPTDQCCSKFIHINGCMWATRFIPLVISTDSKAQIVIRIGAAHAVHADGKGNSGMFLTMCKGAMMNTSKNLGVVTISSTETEIVDDRERFPKCSWFRCFRLAQGDSAKEDTLMQDNESTISIH